MAEVLVFLTSITLILIASIIALAVAKWTKLPIPLLLFVAGVLLGNIIYLGKPVVLLSGAFLSALSIVALLVVVFDAVSKIKFYNLDRSMKDVVWFFAFALLLNLVLVSFAVRSFFGVSWLVAILFSLIISCIEFTAVFPRHHAPQNRIMQLLKDESQLSCAVIVVLPFLILSFLQFTSLPLQGNLVVALLPFLMYVSVGIGIGVILSIILFKLMHYVFLEKLSSFLLVVALLLAYLAAQYMSGSAVLAVATIGLVFGNVFVKQRATIKAQEHIIYYFLEILIFVIAGVIVGFPFSLDFLRISLGLFLLYLLIRFITAQIVLQKYNFFERLEVALFVPKGLITVAIAFALLNYSFTGVVLLLQLLLAFFVYSLIFDTILDKVGIYKKR